MKNLTQSPEDLELERLKSDNERIQRHIAHRQTMLEQLRQDLAVFERQLEQSIKPLQVQLNQLEHSADDTRALIAQPQADTKASPNASALYRALVKSIHPDLAADDKQRSLFQALMIRANDAYANSDESTLSRLLTEARSAISLSTAADVSYPWEQLVRTAAALRSELATINGQYEQLESSDIGKLLRSFQPDVASAITLLKEELELRIQLLQASKL